MSSFKDIIRNISSSITSSNPDLQTEINLIDSFVASQDLPFELEKAHNVSTDLISVYNSIQDSENFCFFFKCVRALLPLLGPDTFILDWWDPILQPILRTPFQPKDTIEEVKGITRDILSCNTKHALKFRADVIELYIKEFSLVGKAAGGEHGVVGEEVHSYWCRNLETVLRGFGSVQTKDFFVLLNTYFVQCQYRLQVLTLLCEFIRRQSMHIHQILETSLFDSLLTSLQKDTSTILLSLSLTTLIMLMPHICTSVIPYLPQLYIIFTRILCWDKRSSRLEGFDNGENDFLLPDEDLIENRRSRKSNDELNWQRFDSTFDTAPSTPPDCRQLFTFLYGMFPCNTVKFLQNPTSWVQEMNYVHISEDIDDEVIRSRSQPLFRRHTLHPDLVLSNYKKELSDTKRWMKLEPADLVAECIGFDIESALAVSGSKMVGQELKKSPIEELELPVEEYQKRDKSRKLSQAISIRDILEVHQALKSGVDIVVGDDPWASQIIAVSNSKSSQPDDLVTMSPPLRLASDSEATISFLQREIMLLRNELNFELYLKQQHMQHIGRLHRDHVLDSSVEAERQNLYNTCRNLKSQLANTQSTFNRLKTETASNKKKQVQRENELNKKYQIYREEKKEWKITSDRLNHQILEAKLVIDSQNRQIDETNAKVFSLENQLKVLEPKLEQLTEYEHRNYQLTKELLLWQEDTRKFQEQKRQMEILVNRWHELKILLQTDEQEIVKLRIFVSEQSRTIDDLKLQLKSTIKETVEEGSAFQKQIKIWELDRDKLSREIQKSNEQYEKVRQKNEELESRAIECASEIAQLKHQLKQQEAI
ncbi:hypothetical protein G9A89_013881 [Geosiphon pyriformis]|nr:hypothetical protein G9A89_013881 [Geosiphon pyriformis]